MAAEQFRRRQVEQALFVLIDEPPVLDGERNVIHDRERAIALRQVA